MADRFWDKVDIKSDDECWEWLAGRKKKQGYGNFWFQGRHWLAHRFAYKLTRNDIPEKMKVCHTCDNPPCCNPKHLFLGTQKDNTMDRDRKGRNVNYRGSQHGSSILTEEQAKEALKLRRPGKKRAKKGEVKKLAEEFGVSKSTISMIVMGNNWKHLKEVIE
jgi:hypothetical protein